MSTSRQRTGRSGEELAARFLRDRGLVVLDRNVRVRNGEVVGELDLIALEGETLAFVEVKCQRAGCTVGPERPVLAVGARKRLRLRVLARAWLAARPALPPIGELRFDVVGVVLDHDGGLVELEHIRDAF
jgi:putative endonuclease